jgi:DNA-binding GntR family transcriptional regulator
MSLLRPVSTTEALVGALRDQIVSGELSPGTLLEGRCAVAA